MSIEHLRKIRLYELERAILTIPKVGTILEIGAGAGWQAKALAEKGFSVEAIDIETAPYGDVRVWPVQKYDGVHIPFPENYFDIVFSSNVLEHIAHIEQFQYEIKRILKPTGIAVHIIPTGSWRFWTNLTHYVFVVVFVAKTVITRVFTRTGKKDGTLDEYSKRAGSNSKIEILQKVVFPPRHGEVGNSITEIYLFSRFRWNRIFRKTGWSLKSYYPVRLFYTGYSVLDARLSMRLRRLLSHIIGSSCLIYVLRPH